MFNIPVSITGTPQFPSLNSPEAVLRLSQVRGSRWYFRQGYRASTGAELQIGNEVRTQKSRIKLLTAGRN